MTVVNCWKLTSASFHSPICCDHIFYEDVCIFNALVSYRCSCNYYTWVIHVVCIVKTAAVVIKRILQSVYCKKGNPTRPPLICSSSTLQVFTALDLYLFNFLYCTLLIFSYGPSAELYRIFSSKFLLGCQVLAMDR